MIFPEWKEAVRRIEIADSAMVNESLYITSRKIKTCIKLVDRQDPSRADAPRASISTT